jgi:hypothetical protein
MTIVVFETRHLVIATPSWAATELQNSATPMVEVHTLEAPIRTNVRLEMKLAEFLDIVASAGKILDLRSIQVKR